MMSLLSCKVSTKESGEGQISEEDSRTEWWKKFFLLLYRALLLALTASAHKQRSVIEGEPHDTEKDRTEIDVERR